MPPFQSAQCSLHSSRSAACYQYFFLFIYKRILSANFTESSHDRVYRAVDHSVGIGYIGNKRPAVAAHTTDTMGYFTTFPLQCLFRKEWVCYHLAPHGHHIHLFLFQQLFHMLRGRQPANTGNWNTDCLFNSCCIRYIHTIREKRPRKHAHHSGRIMEASHGYMKGIYLILYHMGKD